ncbi:MAG: hypothetical protein SGPRY_009337, partial [Prymnesium sp.]
MSLHAQMRAQLAEKEQTILSLQQAKDEALSASLAQTEAISKLREEEQHSKASLARLQRQVADLEAAAKRHKAAASSAQQAARALPSQSRGLVVKGVQTQMEGREVEDAQARLLTAGAEIQRSKAMVETMKRELRGKEQLERDLERSKAMVETMKREAGDKELLERDLERSKALVETMRRESKEMGQLESDLEMSKALVEAMRREAREKEEMCRREGQNAAAGVTCEEKERFEKELERSKALVEKMRRQVAEKGHLERELERSTALLETMRREAAEKEQLERDLERSKAAMESMRREAAEKEQLERELKAVVESMRREAREKERPERGMERSNSCAAESSRKRRIAEVEGEVSALLPPRMCGLARQGSVGQLLAAVEGELCRHLLSPCSLSPLPTPPTALVLQLPSAASSALCLLEKELLSRGDDFAHEFLLRLSARIVGEGRDAPLRPAALQRGVLLAHLFARCCRSRGEGER